MEPPKRPTGLERWSRILLAKPRIREGRRHACDRLAAVLAERPMRVLHVVGGMDRGGVETWLVQVLRHMDPARIRMDFLVNTDRDCAFDEEIEALGSRIHRCVRYRRPWRYVPALLRILRDHGPYDVVHSHVHFFSGFVLAVAKRAGVRGRIAHSHTTAPDAEARPRLYRRPYRWLAARLIRANSTLGLAASAPAATALFGSRWRSDPRWRVLYCGIDLAPFRQACDPRAIRQELGVGDAFVLGHVGRFVPAKNHAFLLQIAAAVRAAAPNTHLLLLGDGPTRPAVEAAARELGLSSHVSFLRTRPDVPRILVAATDAFLFPSSHEGLGLALVEAQAAGLPCFYSDTIPRDARDRGVPAAPAQCRPARRRVGRDDRRPRPAPRARSGRGPEGRGQRVQSRYEHHEAHDSVFFLSCPLTRISDDSLADLRSLAAIRVTGFSPRVSSSYTDCCSSLHCWSPPRRSKSPTPSR